MADEAQVSVTQDLGNVTISCDGTMTLFNSAEFGDALQKAVLEASAVTVDMRRVDFIDSRIVQDLGRAAVLAREKGTSLKVQLLESGYPLKVIRVCSFDRIMNIEAIP